MSKRRRRAVHPCRTARGITPGPCAGRSSQRKTSRRGPRAAWMRATGQVRGPPGVSPLLGAEAHLPEQLVRAPAAGEVQRGQLEGGPGREGVRSDVLADPGEEGLLRGRGPKGPNAVHVPGSQSHLPHNMWRDTGRPRNWWGGTSTLTWTTHLKRPRLSWRPS